MTFPTITIPDPASVGKWLDEQAPGYCAHEPAIYDGKWKVTHWDQHTQCFTVAADSAEGLLPIIQAKLKERDPLEKLRKEWIAAGRPDLNVQAEVPR